MKKIKTNTPINTTLHKTKIYIALIIIATICTQGYAMFNDYEPSARARAMSGAVTSFSDDFTAILYNPAGLKYAETQVGASYFQLFGNDWSTVSTLSGSYQTKFGTFGAGFQSMNVEYLDVNLTTENKFSLGHAFFLNKDVNTELALGYSANVYSLSYYEYDTDTAFGINAGAIATIHQRTKMGFMLTNINKPTIGKDMTHEIPQMLAVGISYIPYQGVITAIDIKKNWDGDTELRTGAEVEIHPMMTLRMGIRNNPASYSAGAGFNVYGAKIDYAASFHAILNTTHHISIGYKF